MLVVSKTRSTFEYGPSSRLLLQLHNKVRINTVRFQVLLLRASN